MGINGNVIPAWLDQTHPNYRRWEKSRQLALDRGDFVKALIQNHVKCLGLRVLDLGSGEGGTSSTLSKDNTVVSFDISLLRLKRQNNEDKFQKINGNAMDLPFKPNTFDLIILQDVIEHLTYTKLVIHNLNKLLKSDGIIYLSTPNKLSFLNFIADPHWGLPLVSVFKRDRTKKYFLKYFRKNETNRKDIAQLLSLNDIKKIFGFDFKINLDTKYSVKKLFEGHKGIVWSDFHIFLIDTIKRLHLDKIILKIVNDKEGFVNKYLNPTFYFILIKTG
jgi:2-polyprenyl-3-methyl-5-hydroxy-6-metoxy-1,4-benzoquinol methylase